MILYHFTRGYIVTADFGPADWEPNLLLAARSPQARSESNIAALPATSRVSLSETVPFRQRIDLSVRVAHKRNKGRNMDERVIKAVRSLVSTYREFEQAALPAKLSLPQYRMLLFLLNFGPRKATDIASVYLLKKPTVAELLKTLEASGLVTRSPDEIDQRSTTVAISARGRNAIKDFERILAKALENLIQGENRERTLEGFDMLHKAFVRVRSERMPSLKGYRKHEALA